MSGSCWKKMVPTASGSRLAARMQIPDFRQSAIRNPQSAFPRHSSLYTHHSSVFNRLPLLLLLLASAFAQPDSSRIVFERDGDIYTIHADGTNEQKVPVRGLARQCLNPVWSPDRLRIAFASMGWSEEAPPPGAKDKKPVPVQLCNVWTAVVGESTPKRMAALNLHDAQVRREVRELEWSADGWQLGVEIATSLDMGVEYQESRFYVMRSDGSGGVRSDAVARDSFFPLRRVADSRSPDGSRALLAREVNRLEELFVAAADGSNPVQVTHTAQVRDTSVRETWGYAPVSGCWSPDGSRVLFIPMMEGTDYPWGNLFAVNADGTGQTQLSQELYLVGLLPKAWSPDGKRLVFEDDGTIYVTDFAAPPRRLAEGRTPDWR